MTTQPKLIPTLDPSEAPAGYRAVLKSDARPASPTGGYANTCRACDWRAACGDPETDLELHNHRCMDYTIITTDGRRLARNDGCSVVFKRIHSASVNVSNATYDGRHGETT